MDIMPSQALALKLTLTSQNIKVSSLCIKILVFTMHTHTHTHELTIFMGSMGDVHARVVQENPVWSVAECGRALTAVCRKQTIQGRKLPSV